MHEIPESTRPQTAAEADPNVPWWKLLNRYHWFVLVVAALGWLFDTMDQQLFNLARVPAMRELLAPSPGIAADPGAVAEYSGYATSIFLMGWATGGLAFGIMGDRVGRAKTMLITILMYSAFTGLSALSTGFWDFAIYRFLTGLGVGGEFAVGVSLVAEVMPHRARPFALGLLQALSAIGNISAGAMGISLSHLEESGAVGSAWRIMFVIGTFPALLAVVIRRGLKEPEQWQAATVDGRVAKQLGSYSEMFSTPRWRRNAIVGLILASSGVVGLWGIGFFVIDLTQSIFRKTFEQEARDAQQVQHDAGFVRTMISSHELLEANKTKVTPDMLLDPKADPRPGAKQRHLQAVYGSALKLAKEDKDVTAEAVLTALDQGAKPQSADDRAARAALLAGSPLTEVELQDAVQQIPGRAKALSGRVTRWAGFTVIMLNSGAFFGIYMFSLVSHQIGRRPTFAISFVIAMVSTAWVFWTLDDVSDVFWMIPIMGFCQLSLFGGFAIYFPGLFPTRLRSTGTSFCYNVGRFVAATGPALLGLLQSVVFQAWPEPMRPAGVTMCLVFLIGLAVLPFAPETKGKPLPE